MFSQTTLPRRIIQHQKFQSSFRVNKVEEISGSQLSDILAKPPFLGRPVFVYSAITVLWCSARVYAVSSVLVFFYRVCSQTNLHANDYYRHVRIEYGCRRAWSFLRVLSLVQSIYRWLPCWSWGRPNTARRTHASSCGSVKSDPRGFNAGPFGNYFSKLNSTAGTSSRTGYPGICKKARDRSLSRV